VRQLFTFNATLDGKPRKEREKRIKLPCRASFKASVDNWCGCGCKPGGSCYIQFIEWLLFALF